jgi:hypothetical protein
VISNIYASCSLSHPGAKQRKGRAARDTEVYQPLTDCFNISRFNGLGYKLA